MAELTSFQIASRLGLSSEPTEKAYDLIIVGGGPAGLTSGIYAAREGMRTLLIERRAVGGQAALTKEIENYPGFPTPIGGAELSARLQEQAQRFGVQILDADEVTQLQREGEQLLVKVDSGQEYSATAVIVATGCTYRRLDARGEAEFIGRGIHFCSTCDGPFYKGQDVFVVGGGNSAFQEGLFLTRFASSVTILVRGSSPRASRIFQEKVSQHEKMRVLTNTAIEEFRGQDRLESIVVRNTATGETQTLPAPAVFVYIGILPNTEFLRGTLDLNPEGFVVTRPNLETSLDGVFAAGDCREGSTKQIAAATGEGATAALMVREYLERRGMRTRVTLGGDSCCS